MRARRSSRSTATLAWSSAERHRRAHHGEGVPASCSALAMEVDQEGALAHIEPTARVLGLGEHGRHTVDTTVLAGGLVTLVVQFRDLSMPASTIIGLAHDLEHQVVLLSGRGHATVATIADVRAALPSNPARVLFDLEHEALRLRHKLSNSYAPLDLSQTEGHIERRSDRIQSFVIHDRRHQTTLFCRTIRIVHFDNYCSRLSRLSSNCSN